MPSLGLGLVLTLASGLAQSNERPLCISSGNHIQSHSVVQSDLFTKCFRYLFNSISLAVETFCTFDPAFQIFPISLDITLACSCQPPSNASMARVLALASLVVAILQYCLHLQRLRDLKKDGHAVSMTIPQQD